MAADGKLVTAHCGHPGRHVIGQYVECLQRCHKRACSGCGKTAFSPFMDPRFPIGAVSCDGCGRIVWSHDGR